MTAPTVPKSHYHGSSFCRQCFDVTAFVRRVYNTQLWQYYGTAIETAGMQIASFDRASMREQLRRWLRGNDDD